MSTSVTPANSASGRIRHDEKITVYVSADELLDLETSRVNLRASLGIAVDRGRIVREAIALVLADFAANGSNSPLAQRLLASNGSYGTSSKNFRAGS